VKRKIFSLSLAIMAVLSLCLSTAAPAMAAKPVTAPSNGSVTVDLLTWYPIFGPGAELGTSALPKVGSVILNTTGNGRLQMLFKIDSVPNLANYDVSILLVDLGIEEHYSLGNFPDVLKTNSTGKGNAMIKMDIPTEFTGDTIWVIFGLGNDLSDGNYPTYANSAFVPRKQSR
jgi:hypothetical protein